MRPVRTAAVGVAALTLAGCGGGGRAASGDAERRELTAIAAAMAAQGRPAEAAAVRSPVARIAPVPAGFLGPKWRIYRVAGGRPHTVEFSVGTGPGRVVLLTGNGAAFGLVTAPAGTRVRDAATAVAIARVYLATTRPTDVLAYAVDRAGQIRFRPGLGPADARRRDTIVRTYRTVVTAPRAERAADGFAVTAYAVRDTALQRRRLTIRPDGAVTDHAKNLVTGLPVPYTL